MDERLLLSREYPAHEEAAETLKRATGNDHPDLFQMVNLLKCWLDLLSESAGAVADFKEIKGQKKGREKLLISLLATSYEHHFGKPPGSGTDSSFRIISNDRL